MLRDPRPARPRRSLPRSLPGVLRLACGVAPRALGSPCLVRCLACCPGLLVDQCACPQHRGGREVVDEVKTVGQPFEAMYDGFCPACEHRIEQGQMIARLADEDGYVHAGRCPR